MVVFSTRLYHKTMYQNHKNINMLQREKLGLQCGSKRSLRASQELLSEEMLKSFIKLCGSQKVSRLEHSVVAIEVTI